MVLNMRFVKSILLVIVLLANFHANSQDKVIVDRRLTWLDFKGKLPKNSPWASECWYNVELEYSNIRRENGRTVLISQICQFWMQNLGLDQVN
jgi:hypothetical protein